MTTRLDRLLADLPVDPVPLAQIERDAMATRRRRTLLVAGIAAATAVVIAGSALAITGTLTAGDGEEMVIDPAARQELAAADGEVCPAVMPQAPGSEGDGTWEAAPSSPDVPTPDQAWVCMYSAKTGPPGPDENGSYFTWLRDGQIVPVEGALLPDLTAEVNALAPQDVTNCTSDLGPRWLLVTSAEGDLTGIAIDDFGCGFVRLTDNPPETEPGEASQPGTVPGALLAPPGFLEQLKAAFATGAEQAPVAERLEIEMGHCWVEPVTFDGEQWNVPFDQQFGGGGLEPRNWQGTGVMTRVSEDEARFDDDGGSSVTFLPVDHPAVTPVEEAICY